MNSSQRGSVELDKHLNTSLIKKRHICCNGGADPTRNELSRAFEAR